MKKIIDGKLYNTETARKLGEYENMMDVRNLAYCYEALYLKKTGEYFLFGEGGPESIYGKPDGRNEWRGNWDIRPQTEESAKRWSEDYLDADEYIGIWGEPEE